jgi:hypothetical protein
MGSWTHPKLEEKPEEEPNALEDGSSDVIPNELSAEEVMEPSCLGFELGFGRGLRRRMRGRRGRGRSSSGNMSSVSAYHSWRKKARRGSSSFRCLLDVAFDCVGPKPSNYSNCCKPAGCADL